MRDALLDPLPPHRRRRIHADAARRLIELGASAARIGHHLLESGAGAEAVPYLLRAAETEAAVGAYRDALALVDALRPDAVGAHRATALALRADLLNAIGDPMATTAYREALDAAEPAAVRRLRVRLAHCAVMAGDLETTAAALAGLDDRRRRGRRGHPAGPRQVRLLQLRLPGRAGDRRPGAAAGAHHRTGLEGARPGRAAGPAGPPHRRAGSARCAGSCTGPGTTRRSPTRVYDGYLCAAEYMLYGPTPYAEVIEVAQDLQLTARRSGALRAEAFAAALIGEAALLSGDLDRAASALTEARDLHHDLGSAGGEAHSLQRLAELHLARGDAGLAQRLLWQALPLARDSVVGRHLLQRIFGTLVLAADDPHEARALVDRAEATIGWDDACGFCSIMLAVPATIVCARAGDLVAARNHLEAARRSAEIWRGTSWEGGLAEAEAAVAAGTGDDDTAARRLREAAEIFDRTGQPRDAQRCRTAARECLAVLEHG